MKSKHRLGSALLILGFCGAAQAVDLTHLSLEELLAVEFVSSASKFPQRANEVPAAIRVITAQDIARMGWRSLGQALASLPGIAVATNRYYDFLGARGLQLSDDYTVRYLMVIDGTPVNDAFFDTALIGASFPLDLALIERIEFVPGAGSSGYGANATLGVISVTTKSAQGIKANHVSVGLDDRGQRAARLTVMRDLNDRGALTLSATQVAQAGRDQFYPEALAFGRTDASGTATLDGVARGLDRGQLSQFFAKYEHGGLQVSALASDRSVRPSTAPHGSSFDDAQILLRDQRQIVSGSLRSELSPDTALYLSAAYLGYRSRMSLPYAFSGLNFVSQTDDRLNRLYTEARLTLTGRPQHVTLVGLDVSRESRNQLLNYKLGNAAHPDYNSDEPDSRVGLYLQDNWRLSDRIQLNTGLRADHSKVGGKHISPRFGLVWQLDERTTTKFILGRAFGVPNPLQTRQGIDPATASPAPFEPLQNRALKAEEMLTREWVGEWRAHADLEISGSIYHYQLHNLINHTQTESLDFQYRNAQNVAAYGLETSVKWRFADDWRLSSNMSRQSAQQANGAALPNVSRWMLKFIAVGPLGREQWQQAWELHASSATQQLWSGVVARNPGVAVLNLTLSRRPAHTGVGWRLRVGNLLNRPYTTPGNDDTPGPHQPAVGRNFTLSVTYER